MKIIKKLNQLKHVNSFFQINTIKGFKYIDKAGEIANKYHKNNKPPVILKMDVNGVVIESPKDEISELRITPEIIWMKFNKIDSLDMIENLFCKESIDILNIIETEKISRLGWRNHFVFEFKDENEFNIYFKNLTNLKIGKISFVKFDFEENNFKLSLSIQPVIKNNELKTPSVLFDIDISVDKEMGIKEISKTLNEFRSYFKEETGFLSLINNTFFEK